MSIEAMKQALELLMVATFNSPELQAKRTEVINAGLAAIEQAEKQEPVAWMENESFVDADNLWDVRVTFNQNGNGIPLYTTSPAAPVQEPFEYWNAVEGWVKIDEVRQHFDSVGCGTIYKNAGEGRAPLYIAAQRQWVGLTQQDIDIAFDDTQEGGGFDEFARAIEQRLKEKNT